MALARALRREGIEYCIVGGNAVTANGYERATRDVDVLMTEDGRQRFMASLVGRGFKARFPGARKSFEDTLTGVPIDVLTAGDFPGNGQRTVVFPSPQEASFEKLVLGESVPFLDLAHLVSLKLVSYGDDNEGRLQDLLDVRKLMEANSLDPSFASRIHPYARESFLKQLAIVEGIRGRQQREHD